jgi:HEAT repeat protein
MPGAGKKDRELKNQEIEQLLKSSNILERIRAVDILLEKKATEKLLSLLYSESWHLREKAQNALSHYTLKELKDKLLPLLDEKMWYVRAAAIRVLANLYTKELPDQKEEVRKHAEPTPEPLSLMYPHLDKEIEIKEIRKHNRYFVEAFNLIYPHLKERNEVVRANSAFAIAKIITKDPSLKSQISKDDLAIIENQLRENKEFDLLEEFMSL